VRADAEAQEVEFGRLCPTAKIIPHMNGVGSAEESVGIERAQILAQGGVSACGNSACGSSACGNSTCGNSTCGLQAGISPGTRVLTQCGDFGVSGGECGLQQANLEGHAIWQGISPDPLILRNPIRALEMRYLCRFLRCDIYADSCVRYLRPHRSITVWM
jgi:hypothetical protein